MRKRNRAARRYLRNVKDWLPCSGKLKREIMARIKNVLDGLPKQIAASYVEDMDTEELLRNLRIRRRIVGIVTCTALIVVTLWAGTVTYAIIRNERLAHGYGVLGEIEVIETVEYTEGN